MKKIRYHDHLIENLKKKGEASAYLHSVAEDGDVGFLLKALRKASETFAIDAVAARYAELYRGTA